MDTLISVIIPVYKVENCLDKCIESVTRQTYKNLEIILVDDGSPDNCPQICDEWAKKDSRITVIHKSNSGVSLSRKIGYENSSGEYIMFVDSDDWISLNAVEQLYQRIISDNSDIVISNYTVVDESGEFKASPYTWMTNTVKSGETVFNEIGTENVVPYVVWGRLYQREILKFANFVSFSCSEDVVMTISILKECKKVSILENSTYYYFQRSSSVMHNRTDEVILDDVKSLLLLAKWLLGENKLSQAKHFFTMAIFRSSKAINKKPIRDNINENFSFKQRKILLEKNIRLYWRYVSIYLPVVGYIVNVIKRLRR